MAAAYSSPGASDFRFSRKEHLSLSQKPQQKSYVSLVLMGSHVLPWANLGVWGCEAWIGQSWSHDSLSFLGAVSSSGTTWMAVGERWILRGRGRASITRKRNGCWVAKQLMILVSFIGQQQIAGVNGFGLEPWFLIPTFLSVKLYTLKPMFPTWVGVCRKLQCFMFFLRNLNVFLF